MLKKIIILLICLMVLVCFAQAVPERLTKQITYDYFISEEGIIHVREIIRVFEGDKVLSKSYNRYIVNPGDDVEDENDRTKVIVSAIYTLEFVAEYEAKIEAEKEENQ